MASRAPVAWDASSRSGSWTASRSWTCGRWISAVSGRSTGRARTPWPAPPRTMRPTTTSTTPTRNGSRRGRCASPLPISDWSSWAAPLARNPAGSARTGSSRTRLPGTSRSARGAGPGSTGPPPSAPSPSPPGTPRPSTTRRASPRSRSAGPGRSPSFSTCATTRSTARSAASPTPRCSTGAAESSATSPSPASRRIGSSS